MDIAGLNLGSLTLETLARLKDEEELRRKFDWSRNARPKQVPPAGPWRFFVFVAGRGAGKTRAGAEWVRKIAKNGKHGRIALIGPTAADVRDVMVEGDALDLDTDIPTPSGWAKFGDLKVGDHIFAGDGTPTKIVALTPIWQNRPCMSLVADGASQIVADDRHKWTCSSRSERRNRNKLRTSIRRTEEIARGITQRRADLYEYEIPLHGSITLPEAILPVPPYTLGAWLGDGDTRGHGALSCHPADAETIENIRADGFVAVKRSGPYEWGIRGLRKRLRAANVIGNKHIPFAYLRASEDQRLALLRGLMDTDGYVSMRGQCAFDNTNFALVEQVRELILSLGYKTGKIQQKEVKKATGCAKYKTKEGGFKTLYRLTFIAGRKIPFLLSRKAKRCSAVPRVSTGRLIRSTERVEPRNVRCIEVAHPSGEFLAGRDFVVTHNSGILACSPQDFMPLYEPSKRQLTWPNGVIAKTYSADEPDRLRGPQHSAGWIDELSAFEYPETFTQFKLGFRLGNDLRCFITMTPKPCAVVRELFKQSQDGTGRVVIVRGSTYENRANLAPEFFEDIIRQYEGTRIGRQELQGELLEDTPGALWNTAILDRTRCRETPPEMARIVVAVDPSVTSSEDSDECGISVCGKGVDGECYVLADRSGLMTPSEWAQKAISAYHEFSADVIVAETNNGGDLVGNTILAIDPSVPFRKVTASRGKVARAEPVSALFEQNRAHLVGNYERLEEQLCSMATDGYTGKGSPDRADAMVWSCTELMLGSGTVQMFPDFRARKRGNGEPTSACHVSQPVALKEWWPRWVSVTIVSACAAHWWCREPSGRMRIYRELLAMDTTPEEFGSSIARNSQVEAEHNRMVPVWMSEKAFDRINGKSIAQSLAEGIQKTIGEQRAFLFIHNDEERAIPDQGQRLRAIQSRLDRMPRGFLSVQALHGGKDQSGWEVVRELLRWRAHEHEALPETPDWDYAKTLAGDFNRYMEYVGKFSQTSQPTLPVLTISSDCKALIQAMSGAVRSDKDDSSLASTGSSFVLQSLRIGALASREEQGTEPMDAFIGHRLDKLGPQAEPISRHLVAQKAEDDWKSRYQVEPVSFARVRRHR